MLYKTSISLKFLAIYSKYTIKYTATKEDPLDRLILDNTCNMAYDTLSFYHNVKHS